MKWSDYLELSARTMAPSAPVMQRISAGALCAVTPLSTAWLEMAHGVTGLVGEVFEFMSAVDVVHQNEEVGDASWFLAACKRAVVLLKAAAGEDGEAASMPRVWTAGPGVQDLLNGHAEALGDAFKRAMFYGSKVIKFDPAKYDNHPPVPLWGWVEHVLDSLLQGLQFYPAFGSVLDANIAKLEAHAAPAGDDLPKIAAEGAV